MTLNLEPLETRDLPTVEVLTPLRLVAEWVPPPAAMVYQLERLGQVVPDQVLQYRWIGAASDQAMVQPGDYDQLTYRGSGPDDLLALAPHDGILHVARLLAGQLAQSDVSLAGDPAPQPMDAPLGVLPIDVDVTGPGTAEFSNDPYELTEVDGALYLSWLNGPIAGATKVLYTVSLDGGLTWGPVQAWELDELWRDAAFWVDWEMV